MAITKALTTEYKGVVITLNVKEKTYTIEHLDLIGTYDTLEAAEKAVRDWQRPEEEKQEKAPLLNVLVIGVDYGNIGLTFREATTRLAPLGKRYGHPEYWVVYKTKRSYSDKEREAVYASRIILDTPENRAILEAVKKEADELKEFKAKKEEACAALKEKLVMAITPAKQE